MNRLALLYAAVAGVANVAGAVALTSRTGWSVRALERMVALSAGFMISVAIGDLLPEAFAQSGRAGALVALAGYMLVHVTQHVLATHFHFGEETHEVSHAVSVSALAGLMLHTFVDGVAIASGFEVSATLGGFVFVAILLHKFPEGLAITSLFLAAGRTRRAALGAASLLGAATIAGAIFAELAPAVSHWGLPLAAGVTLYVGASNLVPELQRGGKRKHALTFALGVVLYATARAFVHS